MNPITADGYYRSWQRFRASWTEAITSPFGLFAYDPIARKHLIADGIELFDYDDSWILPARFEPSEELASLELQIAHHSGKKRVPRYGAIHVRIGDEDYRLQVYSAPGNEYLVSFRDDTSGITTYPGGRVMFVPRPEGDDGGAFDTVLDLNRTVNGPCGYSPLTACALPPRSNTIHAPVTAGEKIAPWMRQSPGERRAAGSFAPPPT